MLSPLVICVVMSSNDPPSSSLIPTTQPGISVPSSLPTSSVPLPVTSQDLVLQLDDDSMRRIVVGVGEYLRNVDTSQPTSQEQSWTQSPGPTSSSVSQSSSAGEESGWNVTAVLGYPILRNGDPTHASINFIGEQVARLTLRPLFPPSQFVLLSALAGSDLIQAAARGVEGRGKTAANWGYHVGNGYVSPQPWLWVRPGYGSYSDIVKVEWLGTRRIVQAFKSRGQHT